MEMQVRVLEGRVAGAVDAHGAAVAEALDGLMEELVELPPDVPPELMALAACAAALPEEPRLQPDMRALALGVVRAWRGTPPQEEKEVLQTLWKLVEFSIYALAGKGFQDWRAYLAGAEEGERRLAADRRAAENRAWAHGKGLAKFFDDLFRR